MLGIERGPGYRESIVNLPGALSFKSLSQGFVAFLFGITGPLAIILQTARISQVDAVTMHTWIFAGWFGGGIVTLVLSLYYRQPIGSAWTLPGGILAGSALTHLSLAEVSGAYIAAGLLILVLGLSGTVKRLMALVPMPIVMGMVAGVFLSFGLKMVGSFQHDPGVATVTFAAFVACMAFRRVSSLLPPILAALIVGYIAAALSGQVHLPELAFTMVRPQMVAPQFSVPALAELVLPLTVTVIAIQNAQGTALLRNAGFDPPVNAMTVACGVGSVGFALFGWVSTCIAGPVSAIIVTEASGRHSARYTAAVVWASFLLAFGLFSPIAVGALQAAPAALMGVLSGLALLPVLSDSFQAAFRGPFRLGALLTFLITAADISIFRIGAPFWGLVGGTLIAVLLEADDFRKLLSAQGESGRSFTS